MRGTGRATGLALLAGLAAVVPGVVAAHEVGASRFDAPIPLSLLFFGAGATVAMTAAWLGRRTGSAPRLGASAGSETGRNAESDGGTKTAPRSTAGHSLGAISGARIAWLRILGRIGFGAVVALAIARGIAGRQVAAENFATVFAWPLWLKGVGLVALLVGSPWRALSPWRGIHALFERIEGRRISLFEYPERAGLWPALVGFVAVVGIAENLTVIPGSPRLTAGLVASYAALMMLGGLAFGRRWFERGDFLEVLYRQFGRAAPVRLQNRGEEYVVELRFPWRGCSVPTAATGGPAFVVAMVYTMSFDGFTSTPEYQRLLFRVRDALGTGAPTGVGLYLVGLVAFVGCFVAASAVGEQANRALSDDTDRIAVGPAARAFAPTVVPIAAAYELAHNFPFVVRNLGRAIELCAGAAGVEVSVALLGWLSVPVFWGAQVLLVVAGHVVAVVAAHQVAFRRYGSLARARRGHAPLVAVMVGYTVLSLWIISRPVVTG
jgi:hypothetical protein